MMLQVAYSTGEADDCALKPADRLPGQQFNCPRPRMWVIAAVVAGTLGIHADPSTGRAEGLSEVLHGSVTPAPMYREAFDADRLLWFLVGTLGTLTCLVPGWALFHGGLLRRYRLQQILERILLLTAVLSLIWVLWVYSISFAPRSSRFATHAPSADFDSPAYSPTWVGGGDYMFLQKTSSQIATDRPDYPLRQLSDGVPHMLFIAFQLSWFTASVVPISFLFDRLYSGFVYWLSLAVWCTIVFGPLTHAVFGGGELTYVLDYGGALPGHFGVGVSMLIVALVAKHRASGDARLDAGPRPVLLGVGTLLIWCGTLTLLAIRAAVGLGTIANVLLGSHLAASAGVVGAILIRWSRGARPEMSDICRGALLGLVANTPAAGLVAPQSSMLIALFAVAAGYSIRPLLERCAGSAAVAEAVMLHGFTAALGLLLTGVFATASVAGLDDAGLQINGLVGGDAGRLWMQSKALGPAALIATMGTLIAILIGKAASWIAARTKLTRESGS